MPKNPKFDFRATGYDGVGDGRAWDWGKAMVQDFGTWTEARDAFHGSTVEPAMRHFEAAAPAPHPRRITGEPEIAYQPPVGGEKVVNGGARAFATHRTWQQIKAKAGVVSMAEFKHFAETVTNLFAITGKAVGVTAAEVKEMIRGGRLKWGDVRP